MGRENSPSARVVELDALRGIAAVAVMAYHYTTRYAEQIGHRTGMPLDFPAGKYGVQLFFLISGFVIFMTLERTRRPLDFVVSRFSRLFPAYWAAMLLTALVIYTVGLPIQRLPAHDLLLNPTMIQEFLGAEHLDGSYWTLQIELFFYAQMLCWFSLGLLGRIRWIIAGWLLLATVEGWFEKSGWHFSYALRELLLLRYIPFFALGILFYRVRAGEPDRGRDIALLGLALLAIALGQPPVMLWVALFCCAVFACFVLGWLRWLDQPLFAWLGAVSYSLYLVHQSIGFVVIQRLERDGVASVVACAVAAAVSVALATGLTWGVERPAMQWIRREWKRRVPRMEAA